MCSRSFVAWGLLLLVELASLSPLNCLFPSRGSLGCPGVTGERAVLSTVGKFICGTALMRFLVVKFLGVAGISWFRMFAGACIVALVFVLHSLSGDPLFGAWCVVTVWFRFPVVEDLWAF